MRLSKKWIIAIGAALLTGVLATGVAVAAGNTEKKAEEVSPAVKELLTEIRNLRQTRMEQLRAEVEALIDKAVADGKITQEQADRLKKAGQHRGPLHMKGKRPGHGEMMPFFKGATEAEVRARLDEAVKNGRITREKADALLKRWQEWKARQSQ